MFSVNLGHKYQVCFVSVSFIDMSIKQCHFALIDNSNRLLIFFVVSVGVLPYRAWHFYGLPTQWPNNEI